MIRRPPRSPLFPSTTLSRSRLDSFPRRSNHERGLATLRDREHHIVRRNSKIADLLLAKLSEILRSEEHTSELQSPCNLVCRLLLEKKNADSLVPPYMQRINP